MSSKTTSVQIRLESHIPCLRDFARLRLFSSEEISAITSRRKKIMLSLDGGGWNDWKKMIEFEVGLEEIRKRRVRKRNQDISAAKFGKGKHKDNGDLPPIPKKSPSSFFLPIYINRLYHMAAHRFPANDSVHASHILYLLSLPSPSTRQISRLLTSNVQRKPMSAFWWNESIRWETIGAIVPKKVRKGDKWEEVDVKIGGGNWEDGRKLCMRALRFLKDEEKEGGKVWREWVTLEEGFRRVIEGRKEAFKLGSQGEEAVDGAKIVQENQGHDAIVQGQILKVVLKHFIQSFPSNPEQHKLMLSLLHDLDVPSHLVQHFLSLLPSSESHVPYLHSTHELHGKSGVAYINELETQVTALTAYASASESYEQFAKWLDERWTEAKFSAPLQQWISNHIIRCCQAPSASVSSSHSNVQGNQNERLSDLYTRHVKLAQPDVLQQSVGEGMLTMQETNWLLKSTALTGEDKVKVIEEAVKDCAWSCNLWKVWLEVKLQHLSLSEDSEDEIEKMFKDAIQRTMLSASTLPPTLSSTPRTPAHDIVLSSYISYRCCSTPPTPLNNVIIEVSRFGRPSLALYEDLLKNKDLFTSTNDLNALWDRLRTYEGVTPQIVVIVAQRYLHPPSRDVARANQVVAGMREVWVRKNLKDRWLELERLWADVMS